MTTIAFNLVGDVREFSANELPSVTSPHTGRALRRVAVEFGVAADQHDEVDAELAAASGRDAKPLDGGDTKWVVSRRSNSHTAGAQPDVHVHRVELEEVEDLQASAVDIGALRLVPAGYNEQMGTDGVLVVGLVAELSGTELTDLEAMIVSDSADYFDVVRHDVVETPVRMRFGRVLFQEDHPGTRRYNIVLVADEGREEGRPGGFALINEPRLSRTVDAVLANRRALATLLQELRSQGVVSDEAVARVEAAAVPRLPTAQEGREFTRTYSLDDWDV